MPSSLDVMRARAPYAYAVMGLIWLVVAYLESSALLLWPVAVLIAGGVLLMFRQGKRLTWAWAISAAVLGLVLSFYQAYVAALLVTGALSTLAGASLVVFATLGLAHVLLGYVGAGAATKKATASGSE